MTGYAGHASGRVSSLYKGSTCYTGHASGRVRSLAGWGTSVVGLISLGGGTASWGDTTPVSVAGRDTTKLWLGGREVTLLCWECHIGVSWHNDWLLGWCRISLVGSRISKTRIIMLKYSVFLSKRMVDHLCLFLCTETMITLIIILVVNLFLNLLFLYY